MDRDNDIIIILTPGRHIRVPGHMLWAMWLSTIFTGLACGQ